MERPLVRLLMTFGQAETLHPVTTVVTTVVKIVAAVETREAMASLSQIRGTSHIATVLPFAKERFKIERSISRQQYFIKVFIGDPNMRKLNLRRVRPDMDLLNADPAGRAKILRSKVEKSTGVLVRQGLLNSEEASALTQAIFGNSAGSANNVKSAMAALLAKPRPSDLVKFIGANLGLVQLDLNEGHTEASTFGEIAAFVGVIVGASLGAAGGLGGAGVGAIIGLAAGKAAGELVNDASGPSEETGEGKGDGGEENGDGDGKQP